MIEFMRCNLHTNYLNMRSILLYAENIIFFIGLCLSLALGKNNKLLLFIVSLFMFLCTVEYHDKDTDIFAF